MPTAFCRYAFFPCLLYSVLSQGPASLTFSRNPVYKSSQLTIICNFSTKVTLTSVKIDAFNGSRLAGSLYCSEKTSTTSGTGVFSEARFTGCPNYTSRLGGVSISMQASPALELVYNCTARGFELSYLRSLMSDSSRLEVQDPVSLALSENPVYNGSRLTITCRFVDTLDVTAVKIEGFSINRTSAGRCYCIPSKSCNCTGVFSGRNLIEYAALAPRSGNVSVFLLASTMLELEYSCTIRVNDSNRFYNWTSESLQLQVQVQPSRPVLIPKLLAFNESQSVMILCQSYSGKPPADLDLRVSSAYESLTTMVKGSEFVSLNLTVSRSWHNAVVLCNITNYNMTATSFIVVNHIAARYTQPLVVSTCTDNRTLNCSAAIDVFPEAAYHWSIPANISIDSYQPSVSSPSITVLQGQSGLFQCSAKNKITSNIVVVTYNVTNVVLLQTESVANLEPTTYLLKWLLPLVCIGLIVFSVILGLLYKRGHFRKRQRKRKASKFRALRMSSNNDCHQADDVEDDITMMDNLIYAGLCAQPAEDFNHDETIALATGRLLPSDHAQMHYSENDRVIPKHSRLLIVAEGTVANIKYKILPTTMLLEYSDQSCSLDDILVKVRLAVSLQSRPAFRTVAFLLRRSKIGLTLSEVDRTVLTFRSATGVSGMKLRDFLTNMVDACLDKQAGSTRVDILNYGSDNIAILSKSLTDLLKVTVTVSADLFGMDVVTPEEGGCTTVADDYFNRDRLDEVIYAEVVVPAGQPRSSPCQRDDQVIYSEIAVKM